MTSPTSELSTGVLGLDPLLSGGLSQGALTLLIGPPGAGKTVLGSQILFAAVRAGLRALIITSYSEGNVKYLSHLRQFEFFDEHLVGDSVSLFSMQTLLSDGSERATAALVRAIRDSKAQIVLLDGFQSIVPLLPDPTSVRSLLAALAVQASFINTTLLVTLAGNARDTQYAEEVTAADVVIGLHYTLADRRHMRMVDVVKQRGRVMLSGAHNYLIDEQGVKIFPRLEVYPAANPPVPNEGRTTFSLAELDKVLGGGPTKGTMTVLAGAPGSGKTTLGLHWALANAGPEAHTVFVTFGEYPNQLLNKAAVFGLDLAAGVADNRVILIAPSSVELEPDQLIAQLLPLLAAPQTGQLVIDEIAALLRALGNRAHTFFAALRALLYGYGVSGLFLLEIDPFTGFQLNLANAPIGILAENLIVVQQTERLGRLRRMLAVLRMRLSDFDRNVCELVISPSGVQVLPPQETAEGNS
jgi:circadian clock protein KaiC